MAGALIVTAVLAPADHAALDGLRRAHFPPGRNHLPAHLTLFHALPPSADSEVRKILSGLAKRGPPKATLEAPYSLGNGVAFRIRSVQLDSIRDEIADHFHGLLTAQDSSGWRAHVTIQNKVTPAAAKALLSELQRGFEPRSLGIHGLSLDRYAGGPWEPIANFPFRG